jgi:hypothetical protein
MEMNMKKMLSIMIISLFLTLTATSITGSSAVMSGDIDVDLKEWLGIVYPRSNIEENQTVLLDAEAVSDGNETYYEVNDTLTIMMDINDESNRTFLFPRSVFYTALFFRKILDVKLLPIFGYFSRLCPVRALFNTVNVGDSFLGKNASSNINITMQYTIDEETYNNGENMTMHFLIMGFMPGDLNGLGEQIPIISYEKIPLKFEYF